MKIKITNDIFPRHTGCSELHKESNITPEQTTFPAKNHAIVNTETLYCNKEQTYYVNEINSSSCWRNVSIVRDSDHVHEVGVSHPVAI